MTPQEIRDMKDRIIPGSPQESLRIELAIETAAQIAELASKFADTNSNVTLLIQRFDDFFTVLGDVIGSTEPPTEIVHSLTPAEGVR